METRGNAKMIGKWIAIERTEWQVGKFLAICLQLVRIANDTSISSNVLITSENEGQERNAIGRG